MTFSFVLLIFLLIINKILCNLPCGCPHKGTAKILQAVDEYKKKYNMAAGDNDKPRWEGDMIINPELLDYWYNPNKVRGRLAFPLNFRWPNNTVPYYISDGISNNDKKKIADALIEFEKKTDNLIKFDQLKQIPNLKNYVIVKDDGANCFSHVGMAQEVKAQVVNLQKGNDFCYEKSTIQHEFMHALGFQHEHTRPDRDKYIRIEWQNIQSTGCDAYDICTYCDTHGLTYDYHSIMHFKEGTGACKAGIKAISPLISSITAGPNPDGPTPLDLIKIRAYYTADSRKLFPQLILTIIYFLIQYIYILSP